MKGATKRGHGSAAARARVFTVAGAAARVGLCVALAGVWGLGCEAEAPTFSAGDGSTSLDIDDVNDPSVDFERITPPPSIRRVELVNTEQSVYTLEVRATLTNDPQGETRGHYKVVWCREFDVGQGPTVLPLCTDDGCGLLWGDSLTQGTAKLPIFGSDFELGPDLVTTHFVRAILVDTRQYNPNQVRCPSEPADGFRERLSFEVDVRRLVGGPKTEVLPPPGAGCHTAKFALRARIDAVEQFDSATYRVRWYNGHPDTGVEIQSLETTAVGGAVCSGTDSLTTGNAACFLTTGKFARGQTICVTARVTSDGSGNVPGDDTLDPACVQICDAWPDCQGFDLVMDPPGAAGKLTCRATCSDPDGDPIYARAVFVNRSDASRPDEVITLEQPVLLGANGQATVKVTLDLATTSPKFARKGNDVHCELFPFDAGHPNWQSDPGYPYTNDADVAKDENANKTLVIGGPRKIANTPPEIRSVRLLPTSPPLHVGRTFMIDLEEVVDVDDVDTKLQVTYRWVNESKGNAPLGPPIFGEYNVPVGANPEASAIVPSELGGIQKGERLCGEVTVADGIGAGVGTDFARLCVTLENAPPTIQPPPAVPGQPAPKLSVSIQPDLNPGDPPACAPTNAPALASGVYYTWEALRCQHNGQLFDPDASDHGQASFTYRWHNCNFNTVGALLYSSNQNLAPPNTLPKNTYVCCSVVPCDPSGCNDAATLAMAPKDAAFIANSPPQAPAPSVAPAEMGADGDKLDFFECHAAPLDCDAEDATKLTPTYRWFKVPPGGGYVEIGASPAPKVQKFSPSELTCQDKLVCEYSVTDGSPAVTSPKSAPFTLANQPPKLQQLTVQASGLVTPTSTVACKWSGVSDPNQDPITEVRVLWYNSAGQPLLSGPQVLAAPTQLAPAGEATLKLGTCGGTTLVSPGDEVHCRVQLCDGCDCSDWISSAEAPFGSTLTVSDNPAPISLKPGASLATLSTLSLSKQTPFTCSLNPQALDVCDQSAMGSLQYVYQLVGTGNTVLVNAEGTPSTMQNASMTLQSCPAVNKAWCRITIKNAQGQTLLTGTSATADINESPPQVQVALEPTQVAVGDALFCNATVTDPDGDEPTTLVRWFKGTDGTNLVEQPSLQGQTSVVLAAGSFKSGDVLRCSVTADDGCFPPVVGLSPTVIVGNSAPTIAAPVIDPTAPKAASTLTCTVDLTTYNDPDGNPLDTITFAWQTATSSAGPWGAVNPLATCQKNFPLDGKSTLVLSGCSPQIGKGTFVRCTATALDAATKLAGSPGNPVTSAPVQVVDSLPYFTGPVTVAPKPGQLPSAPILQPSQDGVVCQASAQDDDPGDVPIVTYVWALLDAAGGVKQTLTASANNSLDVTAAFPSALPCDQVRCTAELKTGTTLVDTQSATTSVRNGGSLYFDGSPARVDITSQAPAGTQPPPSAPPAGLMEMWVFAETLPGAGARHVLAYGSTDGGTPAWEISVTHTGAVQLRRNGVLATLSSGQSWPALAPGAWTYVALQWQSNSTSLRVGASSAGQVAVMGTTSFDLVKLVLGSTVNPPRGWIDELRVRNVAATPSASEIYFQETVPNLLAVYHFELDKTLLPIDSGPWQFHGSFPLPQQRPAQSYHAQLDTCGVDACADDGPCVTKPSVVTQIFAGPPIAPGGGASTYQVRCEASGAIDLQAGPVVQYQFTWRNATTGAVLAGSPLTGPGHATLTVPVASGCIDVVCEAAPIPVAGGAPGSPGVSGPAKLCRASTATLVGFGCDDGNPCSADVADTVLGCQHGFDGTATCSATCPGGLLPTCSPGDGFPCLCDDPCPDDPEQPCVDFVLQNGTCVPQNKAFGTVCSPFDACAQPGATGICTATGCSQYATIVCDDANPCTDDSCSNTTGCVFTPNNNNLCSDGNACTHPDQCVNAQCLSGGAVLCDDGNPCTADSCDSTAATPGQAACVFTPLNGGVCDDGNPCTDNDTCVAGTCLGTGAVSCDDNNPCTTDSCTPAGGCQHTPNNAACSDGDACTSPDLCSGGQCVSGPLVVCDDNNPCTDDSCDPGSGCVHTPNANPCSDNSECTINDACNPNTGQCVGTPLNCQDGNPCTTNTCAPASGCQTVDNSGACSDGDACTANDVCVGGNCVGTVVNCDDGNPCTDDFCDTVLGCQYLNNVATCDDGDACTAVDVCVNGVCQSGAPVVCDDGADPCNVSLCNPASGCQPPIQTSDSCNDGNACTTGDLCQGGVCQGTGTLVCDDGNPCTLDTCDPTSGCKFTNQLGVPCDDGNECTLDDTCVFVAGGMQCVGQGDDCNDGNVCTDDNCHPIDGCVYTNNTLPCSDGDLCTSGDTCSGGACVGVPTVCNDNNPCTDDDCAPNVGCFALNNNSNACTDGDACTTVDQCVNGACVGSVPPNCDDGNPCTDDSCDAAVGCVNTHNTQPCDDGDACTTLDTCNQGFCIGGPLLVCNDHNPCTDDSCDPAIGCVYTPNTLVCSDGDACTVGDQCAGGACVPGPPDPCQDGNPCTDPDCDPLAGCTFPNNTVACDDGNACTVGDQCAGGQCVSGPGADCDDGNVCTDNPCDASEGCDNPFNSNPCSDGNPCTLGDQCGGGACQPGAAKSCDDGNVCTADACDAQSPNGDCVHTPISGPCEDGDNCTATGSCEGGTCVPGPPVNCDDGNPCTSNNCLPASGCTSAPLPGVPCDDGDQCTISTCSAGQCVTGAQINCDDGNPCTVHGCDPAAGCTQTAVADGTLCDDDDPCTLEDVCQGGACTGADTYCCAQSEVWQSGCDFTTTLAMTPSVTESYTGANCAATQEGGRAVGCFPSLPAQMEICLDLQGAAAAGSYFLMPDTGSSLQLEQCSSPLQPGACTSVQQAPESMLYWQLLLHSASTEPTARVHVRCPQPLNNCQSASPPLLCDKAFNCVAGGTSWGTTITQYGPNCSGAFPHGHRAFQFSAQSAGNYTVWLNSSADVGQLQVFVAPVPPGTVNCTTSQAALCAHTGQSPFTFTATGQQDYCIFVEQLSNLGNVELITSVSCH